MISYDVYHKKSNHLLRTSWAAKPRPRRPFNSRANVISNKTQKMHAHRNLSLSLSLSLSLPVCVCMCESV